MKLAFADVYRYVADPRTMRSSPQQLLDPGLSATARALIDPPSVRRTSVTA